jgi:hypothetical protein
MTTEQTKSLCETATERLLEALERGHSDALRAYLQTMARRRRIFPGPNSRRMGRRLTRVGPSMSSDHFTGGFRPVTERFPRLFSHEEVRRTG